MTHTDFSVNEEMAMYGACGCGCLALLIAFAVVGLLTLFGVIQ